ncbi:MAG: hypothetical protein P1U65_16140 [Minwuia sp.]|nr:hypothetical protein [Minwuia sp.]
MSAGEKEPKIWHQVADAGFGAAVEASGFRRVGRTMWRRDSDRVAWRVCLARGFAMTPNSFRGSYGGFVQEVDDLVKLYHPKRRLENMPGTSTPWHLGGGLEYDRTAAEIQALKEYGEAYEARPTGWRGIWADLVNPLPSKPPAPHSSIPFYATAGISSAESAFIVGGEWDVAAVSEVMTRQWRNHAIPWIEDRFDFLNLYEQCWGPKAHKAGSSYYVEPESYAAAKLVGDQGWIDTMAETAFARGRVTYDEIWLELEKNGDFKREAVRSGEVRRETLAQNKYRGRLMDGATVLAIAEAMSIKVPEHGIDFEAFGRPIEPIRI